MIDALTQREWMITRRKGQTLARASELIAAGVAATTIARAVADGDLIRIGCGLYQLPGGEVDTEQNLA